MLCLTCSGEVFGQQDLWTEAEEARKKAYQAQQKAREKELAGMKRFGPPATEDFQQLHPEMKAWVNRKRGILVVDGTVTLNRGSLEMFASPMGMKGHESIIGVDAKPFVVHAGLLLLTGGKQGTPVQFGPEYQPATGPEVKILILWYDENGKRRHATAQSWIQNMRTKQELQHPFVFAGSAFWTHPKTGEQHYMADSGDFICVSNFPSATLDLPIKSEQANSGLMFSAFTERIPPRETPVRLVLWPQIHKKTDAEEDDAPTLDEAAGEET